MARVSMIVRWGRNGYDRVVPTAIARSVAHTVLVMNGLATRSVLAVTRLPSASTSLVLPGVQIVLGGQLRRSGKTPIR